MSVPIPKGKTVYIGGKKFRGKMPENMVPPDSKDPKAPKFIDQLAKVKGSEVNKPSKVTDGGNKSTGIGGK